MFVYSLFKKMNRKYNNLIDEEKELSRKKKCLKIIKKRDDLSFVVFVPHLKSYFPPYFVKSLTLKKLKILYGNLQNIFNKTWQSNNT